MGSEYIGNGYGQSKAGGCVGGVGCLADVGCGWKCLRSGSMWS